MRRVASRVPVLSRAELAVLVSGVVSMGLEMLAIRVVAPQFGSHIYTTGSIIGVSLAALSLGYHQGGKRASRATTREMVWLFIATAAYVALVIYARDALLTATATIPLPSRYASIPSIVLLFGPPTYFLGFISPYAAELSTKEGIGEASGHVYALGTIGSLAGTFGTTFVLVPWLSIDGIALFFGVLLVAAAVAMELPRPSPRPAVAATAVTVLLFVALVAAPVSYAVQGEVIHHEDTQYQELVIADSGDTRTMHLDGKRHSAMDFDDPARHVFDYTRYFHAPYLFAEDPDEIDRVLFVGGGGFTGPKAFLAHDEDVEVDVVEIDPAVVDAAEEYFGVDPEGNDRLNVHVADGRQFLQNTDHTYDAIVLDAYKMDKVPFQLTTEEFMQVTSDRLSEDGVLVANVISAPSGPASDFYRAEYKTMERAFPQVYAFRTAGADVVQNVEVVATKNDERLAAADLEARNEERAFGLDMREEIDTLMEPPATDDVPVLTDDRGSVDSLLDPMIGQRYVIEESDADDANATDADETSPAIADARASAEAATG